MFGTQSERLLRTQWKTPTMLAEELYAMFQDDIPVETAGGLAVSAPGDATPLQVARDQFSDEPLMNFKNGGQDPTASMGTNSGGGLVFAAPNFTFQYQNPDGTTGTYTVGPSGSNTQSGATQKQTSGGGVPGQVQSGGPGKDYSVTIYPQGLNGATLLVNVTQLSIDPNATIPAGTWAVVNSTTLADGKTVEYTMQVPVWGADPQ